MVISMSVCTLAHTPEQTIRYAMIMFPGPPYDRALPVPTNRPLPMLEPRAMIFQIQSAMTLLLMLKLSSRVVLLTWSFRELILAWSVPRSCLIESDPDSTSVACGSS